MSNIGAIPPHLLNENNNIVCKPQIKGICMEMCPLEEVMLREKEKLVHVLEATAAGHKLVKSYSRSAAASNMAIPELLRPFRVLYDTVQYLLLEVSNRSDVKSSVMYDFLNDRLRAVRQDMTIQRLPPEQCVVLLEPMIRFYVYYGYRLCDYPLSDYDPVLNKKYLLECIKWYLNSCDILQRSGKDHMSIETGKDDISSKDKDDMDLMTDCFNLLEICTRQRLVCDRILVESLYILCNLDEIHPLYRYLSLPSSVKRESALKLAYHIALANINGNYIRVLRLAQKLCTLTYAAVCLHLPVLQRQALQAMSHAYNSQHLTVPATVIRQWLAFNTSEEVVSTCTHYGLKVDRDKHGICFNRASFKGDVALPQVTKCFSAKVLHLKLEDVISYTV